VVQTPPHPVKLPENEHVAFAKRFQARLKAGTLVFRAGGPVRLNLFLADARGDQGVLLKVERLASVGFRDPGIADQHVSQTIV